MLCSALNFNHYVDKQNYGVAAYHCYAMLISCQKEQEPAMVNELENKRDDIGGSTQKRRGRGKGLFPNDSIAANELKKFDDFYKGFITDVEFGSRGVDTAIWTIEGYANYNYRFPDYAFIPVKTDSITLSINLIDSVTIAGKDLKLAYEALNDFIKGGNIGKIQTVGVAGDLSISFVSPTNIKVNIKILRITEIESVQTASEFEPGCKKGEFQGMFGSSYDECLSISDFPIPPNTSYACGVNPNNTQYTNSQWLSFKANCRIKHNCRAYYTNITDGTFLLKDSSAVLSCVSGACVCSSSGFGGGIAGGLNAIVREIESQARAQCTGPNKRLIAVEVMIKRDPTTTAFRHVFEIRYICGERRSVNFGDSNPC